MKTAALGKGLKTLFSEQEVHLESSESTETRIVSITDIILNKNQPRKLFNEQEIEELKNSIIRHGLLTPILVQKVDDKYQIIAGERRYRAVKAADLKEILVRVIPPKTEEEILEISLIENIQRQDLNAVEIGEALYILTKKYKLTHEKVAEALSINRVSVTNFIRLNELPEEIKESIREKKINFGAAKAILRVESDADKINVTRKAIANKWSVRDIEEYVKKLKTPKVKTEKKVMDVFYKNIEDKLRVTFNTKVTLTKLKDKGRIEIEYYNDEDLERILGVIQ
ncbi:ParB/RepB/Spo0J family partition protein [Candidatus Epulonipiscium viviparus]|uniref:ParB/RepB/Spo0J family partition protein n=1 Tax=Candidatus Epulonipiscium viviparus TaxID=420336 RepID=UPI0027380CB6|nr:ParB/RepB/Spo0J family partition protein [Candidatus Epulopiscium viviparus]